VARPGLKKQEKLDLQMLHGDGANNVAKKERRRGGVLRLPRSLFWISTISIYPHQFEEHYLLTHNKFMDKDAKIIRLVYV